MTYAEKICNKLNSSMKLKAVAYYRVSTDNEGQKESCANQQLIAKKYISEHPNIELIAEFVDDGISGKNAFTRPQYKAMLKRILDGDIDIIITKSLSRLNRDESDSIELKNLLIDNETTILTLEDYHVHDLEDMNSGLLLSIKRTIDAQFVKQQSINGKKAQEVRCEKKILGSRDISFGYVWNKDSKTISINQTEAEAIRWLFEEYVYRNGTPASIYKSLKTQGFNICERTIINYLKDERYIGRFYMNKWDSKLGTGQKQSKRFKLPKDKWILVERPDLQIIDTELFDLAQRIRQSRISQYNSSEKKTTQTYFQGTHKYSGKVFCPVCGKPYQFDNAGTKIKIPQYRIKKHSECSNPVSKITESDLEQITRIALKKILEEQRSVCDNLEKVLTDCIKSSADTKAEINKLQHQIENKESQINTLIETLSKGVLNASASARITDKINSLTNEIEALSKTIKIKDSIKLNDSYVTDKVNSIRDAIEELRNFETIDRTRILNYIERIELPPDRTINIILKSGHVIDILPQNNRDYSTNMDIGMMRMIDVPYSWPVACPHTRFP